MTFGAEGTGFDTCYISFFMFLLCFIKRCYDKEEFDTDCSYGQGSYPFLNKKFQDFSRTFKDTFPIFQGLYSIQKEP